MLRSNKFAFVILTLIIILMFIVASLLIWIYLPGTARYTITYTYKISVSSVETQEDSTLEYILPCQQQHQSIKNLGVYHKKQPLEYVLDKYPDYTLVTLARPEIATQDTTLVIRYGLILNDTATLGKESPDYRHYLGPDEGMETTHPLLITTSRRIAGVDKDTLTIVGSIKKHILTTVSLTDNNSRSALQTLSCREGDEKSRAFLFAALCRTRGIAARVKKGIQLEHLIPGQRINYNNTTPQIRFWPEYYNSQKGWQKVNLDIKNKFRPTIWPILDLSQYNWGENDTASLPDSITIQMDWHNKATYILIIFFFLATVFWTTIYYFGRRQIT